MTPAARARPLGRILRCRRHRTHGCARRGSSVACRQGRGGCSARECGACSGRLLSGSRGRLAPMIKTLNKRKNYMNRINFSYSALVLVIAGLIVSLTGCGQKRELDPRTQPELVRVVEIGSSSGADPAFTGVVSARVQSNLGFRVPGKITSRLVDTGQFVRAGQPLMTIDRTDYVHAITARAETVTAAKAKAVQAAADEARYRGLVKTGAISASIYDRSEEHTSELQSQSNLVCRLLLEKKKHI